MPRVKRYLRCIICGKKKTIPKRKPAPRSKPRMQKPGAYVPQAVYELDPYCSTECCKDDHAAKARQAS